VKKGKKSEDCYSELKKKVTGREDLKSQEFLCMSGGERPAEKTRGSCEKTLGKKEKPMHSDVPQEKTFEWGREGKGGRRKKRKSSKVTNKGRFVGSIMGLRTLIPRQIKRGGEGD